MRHQLQRIYIDCPDWRLKVDVRGRVPAGQELSGQLDALARRAATIEDLRRGLTAFANCWGMVAIFGAEPQWDGSGLELEVGLASPVSAAAL